MFCTVVVLQRQASNDSANPERGHNGRETVRISRCPEEPDVDDIRAIEFLEQAWIEQPQY
jgi:hypothetical protein